MQSKLPCPKSNFQLSSFPPAAHGAQRLRAGNFQLNNGFTLIELMTVIMTMALLFSLGYANYRDFQRRQVLEGAVREFKTDLRLAQQLALTGVKEAGCGVLDGYALEKRGDSGYAIEDKCSGGGGGTEIKRVNLSPNIFIGPFPAPGNRFLFRVLAGGIDRTSDVAIEFRHEVGGDVLETKDVVITTVGEIY